MDELSDIREWMHRGRAPPTNLPVIRDQLIGRERELQLAKEILLREDVGLLTLTGAGGEIEPEGPVEGECPAHVGDHEAERVECRCHVRHARPGVRQSSLNQPD